MPKSAELRTQVEELALGLALGREGSAEDWGAAAGRIQRDAEQRQATGVASAAGEVARAIAEDGGDSANVVDAMRRLQEAVDGAAAPEIGMAPAEDPELLTDFVLEAREHLSAIEAQALTLERSPSDGEALNSAFRAFHTIKGLAGFLELPVVQEMAHQVEAVLDRARNGDLTITTGAIDVILQAADHLKRWTAHVEQRVAGHVSEPPPRDASLLARIGAICTAVAEERAPDLIAMVKAVYEGPYAPSASKAEANGPASRTQTMAVKVDTAKLDALVDMAGELVIAESLVRHDEELAALKSQRLQRKLAQLDRITAELQKTAMALRLVPI